jgi:DNA primase
MNVEELLHRENIRTRSAGKDILVRCLNPEHDDRNPSMRVDKITGAFNCFSCGFHGNIFSHFNESIDTTGIKVIQLKEKISGLLKNEILFPLGKEPFKRKHRGISAETYEFFEAFTHDNYDGRIVFPIRDITGRILGFLGRYAFSDATPKYFWDPPLKETPIFPPKPDIYKDSIIVVEGLFDLLNLWDKGLTNVVCTFGKSMGETRNRNKRVKILNRFIPLKIQGVKKVYILYDTGAESASNKLANLLSELFIAESIEYPGFSKEKDAGNLNKEEVDNLKEYIYETNSTS